MSSTTRRIVVLAVVVVLAVAGGGAWWRWNHRYLDVPGCRQALTALQQTLGGTWTLDPASASSDDYPERADCHYTYAAADNTVTGTVWISMNGHTDAGHRQDFLTQAPCTGTEDPVALGDTYTASRQCTEVLGATARVALLATTDKRYARVAADLTSQGDADPDLTAITQDTARRCMDVVSTLPAAR